MIHLVTGATGNVGSRVAEGLLERGVRPRVFARDPEKVRVRFGDRVDVVVGDLEDAASLARAMSGADTVFLVNSGPALETRDAAAAHVAKTAGARVVKLSSIDALEQNIGTGVWHAHGEAAIRASGVAFTFVQPSGFMTNALFWAASIKAEGVVRSATGNGRIPFIHPDDIAAVAVAAITTPDYLGKSLPITGPEALTYAEMTAQIGAAIGRPLTFQAITEEDARRQQVAWAAPPAMVEARLSIFRAIREGRLAAVTDTVDRLLGRRPITFDRWAEEHAAAFRTPSPGG
jgi:(4-alkanoyl-5-oxo-2,5-dihydrofuran-3-yl)methyl phosphate reductase